MSNYPKSTKKIISSIANDLKIAIVYSTFNSTVTKRLLTETIQELKALQIPAKNIICEKVDGALEIPMALLMCKKYYKVDVLIAIGCVIRGETYHFEVVSNTSANALAYMALNIKTPVINGILTCENMKQAKARISKVSKHIAKSAINAASLNFHLKQTKKTKNKLWQKNNEKNA